MSLNKYYRHAAIYPSLVAILIVVVYSVIDNYNYKSEWLTADAVIGIGIVTSIIYSLIICFFSLPIFLNNFQKIREKKILNFLSWFLMPFGWIVAVFGHEIWFNLKFHTKFDNAFIYVLIITVPFVIGLSWSYLKFRKAIRAL